ncbi:MAG: alpha/beta hydrolase [Patescibacteria group bacterium]
MPELIINNKRINYMQEGKGSYTILLIHGWGGSMKSLSGLFSLLKDDYQCVMLDLPGFGKSDNPDPDWGIGEYAGLISEFIKKFGLKKVILFGHSFGGAISIYLSAKYPDLIDKLILAAPSYRREKPCGASESKTFWERVKNLTKNPIYERLKPRIKRFRKFLYKIFYPKSEVLKYPHLEPNFRKIVTQDLSDLLPKIKQKTLILWGDKDTFVPLSHSFILKAKIKNSKLKVYNDIGHGLPKFKPEWVYMEIKKFIEED